MRANYWQRFLKNGMWVLALLLPLGQAQALVLDTWNDADLDASGDYISVSTGMISDGAGGNDTWFSLQWNAGAANSLTALGIDTVFYNCAGCSFTNKQGDDAATFGGVKSVWEAAIGTGTDVTADWNTNFGGGTSGGGFGSFNSGKNLDGGGTAGIDPDPLIFVLNGEVSFVANGAPTDASFAVHVRYEEDCSGWASDGSTGSADSGGGCGATVPEPGTLALAGIGLFFMGFMRRFRHPI